MESILIFLIGGIFLGMLILFIMNKFIKPTKDSNIVTAQNQDKTAYIKKLDEKFLELLEAYFYNQTSQYNALFSQLNDKEKALFKKYMESKIKKGEITTKSMNDQEITTWEICRWVLSLMFESAVVIIIGYLIYTFLNSN